jgi:hypothetical protein
MQNKHKQQTASKHKQMHKYNKKNKKNNFFFFSIVLGLLGIMIFCGSLPIIGAPTNGVGFFFVT